MKFSENEDVILYLKKDVEEFKCITERICKNYKRLNMEETVNEQFFEGLSKTKLFESFLTYIITNLENHELEREG